MPQIRDVTQDTLLTNVSVKFSNPQYIAEQVFPTIEVQYRTGFYFKYDKSNLKVDSSLRTGVTRANRVDFQVSKTAYGPLLEHSLEEAVEYDMINQAMAPMEPLIDATENVTEKIALEKEDALATLLAATATVTQNVTLSGTAQWSDYTNSDPFPDIQTAISTVQANSFRPPNTLVLGQPTYDKLKNHPKLLDRVKYTERGVITPELLASLFGLENVLIGSAVKNTAVEGQTDATGYVWGKHAWVMYVSPQPGIKQVSGGYHLQMQGQRKIDRWDEPEVKAQFVRFTDYYQAFIVAVEAIYLIKNATA